MDDLFARVLSVSELTGLIKETLSCEFPAVHIEGEISNCANTHAGHIYFSLKDEKAVIQVVVFAGTARRLDCIPENGAKVRVHGALTVYALRGQYQIIAENVEHTGYGRILEALERLKSALSREGLFDEARKKQLPALPSKIAVVTSPTGAAIRDIIRVVQAKDPGLQIIILGCAVQGESAAADIAAKIRLANTLRIADIIVVSRGGGSIEDLLPFSDEEVVRAVAASAIPTVSAVGHEIDWALCDFAADVRAPTPSAAADLVTEGRLEIANWIEDVRESLIREMQLRLADATRWLDEFDSQEIMARLGFVQSRVVSRINLCSSEIKSAMTARLKDAQSRLEQAWASLESSNPQHILARGFAIVRKENEGTIIRSERSLNAGDTIEMEFTDGKKKATVTRS